VRAECGAGATGFVDSMRGTGELGSEGLGLLPVRLDSSISIRCGEVGNWGVKG